MKKLLNLIIASIIVLTLYNCNDEPVPVTEPLIADFQTNSLKINAGDVIVLQSSVTGNPSTYLWTFEEGSPNTSDEVNPSVMFNTVGIHNISLTVSRESDMSSVTINKEVIVCPSEGLIAYYPLDGNAVDQSSNNFNGSINGAVPTTDKNDKSNMAFDFDGESYIETSTEIDDFLSEGATFSAWINLKVSGTSGRIISNYSGESTGGNCLERVGFNFTTSNEEGIRLIYATDGNDFVGKISSPNSIILNQWHHVVGVWKGEFDSSSFELYVDGNKVDSSNLEDGFPNCGYLESPLPFNFGRGFCAAGECGFYTGAIDDIRIYNRALSQFEIEIIAQ